MKKWNLQTDRLNLRLVTEDDLEAIHALHSLPETDRYNTLGIPENIMVTQTVIAGWLDAQRQDERHFTFAMHDRVQNVFIGLIAINCRNQKYNSAEIWYKLHPASWNKGYATEAVKRVIAFGFQDLNLHRIEAGCAADNTGSVRTMEKAGMIYEGRKRKVLPLKSGWTDSLEYATLSTD